MTDPELTRSIPKHIERPIRGRKLLVIAIPYVLSVLALLLLAWG